MRLLPGRNPTSTALAAPTGLGTVSSGARWKAQFIYRNPVSFINTVSFTRVLDHFLLPPSSVSPVRLSYMASGSRLPQVRLLLRPLSHH